MSISRNKIRNLVVSSLWIAMGAGLIVLLLAAIQRKNTRICKGFEVNIRGSGNNVFVDRKDVQRLLNISNADVIGRELRQFRLEKMENKLERNVWIKHAELFFDNNELLQVKITEREPVARIFTSAGASFYIDSSLVRLPLSEKFSARVPVFTGFPIVHSGWTRSDSSLLQDIKNVSQFISGNPFWMAQIAQVDINSAENFEMIPTIGDHIILFGDGRDIEKKFRRLYIFYSNVLSKIGWNKYAAINVQFKGQVVATRREGISKNAAKDTTRVNLLLNQMMARSPQQWMGSDTQHRALPNYPATRPVATSNTATPLKTLPGSLESYPVKSNAGKPAFDSKSKPRALMPKASP
jgi:cell division protein FtsQ